MGPQAAKNDARESDHWEIATVRIENGLRARLKDANEATTKVNLIRELDSCTAKDFAAFIDGGTMPIAAPEFKALRSLVNEWIERSDTAPSDGPLRRAHDARRRLSYKPSRRRVRSFGPKRRAAMLRSSCR